MTLSVVIPTLGRPSLEATLASCAAADEIVVVLDTARGATELPCQLPSNAVFAQGEFGVTGGHAGRAHGIQMASGTHLAFMDDDDTYVPGAISLMRAAACDVPVVFRMDHYRHGVLWRNRQVEFGNVSTQMYVVPNDPARLGTWTPHVPGIPEPGGDFTFLAETVALMGDPIWREEITTVIRPHEHPTVAVVTPWTNHLELLPDFERAIELGPPPNELIVVDNASDPPLAFAAIRSNKNVGFSGGSNLGMRAATSDIVVFTNNDVALSRPGWLAELCHAVGPGVLVGPIRDGRHADVDGQSFPYIDGWCLAGMRADLLELGGWDESFDEPSYYGDNDLCFRARAAGMTLRDVQPGLVHKLNGTAGSADRPEVRRATAANRARYEARVRELLVPA